MKLGVGLLLVGLAIVSSRAPALEGAYAPWKNGPPKDSSFFPLAVWLQSPGNAGKFKAIGINVYIGLWEGPTDEQLAALKKAGMPVICEQNPAGLKHKDDPTIIAWMHGDEPDNAQSNGQGGYGPPILPAKIIAEYGKMRQDDPTRPVMLNLGQGVAWDGWFGRGARTNHPEDYAEYVKGADMVSFDIYPANHDRPDVHDKLWLVPFGVDRLIKWSDGKKPVWDCIECTPISDPQRKPTPYQVRAEVWMSLIHGSRGIIYFVHVFKPKFIEAGLLADTEMAAAVGKLNRQITELAPVLNSPSVKDGAAVETSNKGAPIDILVKKHEGATYVFSASMRDADAKGTFRVKGLPAKVTAEALGENRKIDVMNGAFSDEFKGCEVHLYKIHP
jgi:hypothetical protein